MSKNQKCDQIAQTDKMEVSDVHDFEHEGSCNNLMVNIEQNSIRLASSCLIHTHEQLLRFTLPKIEAFGWQIGAFGVLVNLNTYLSTPKKTSLGLHVDLLG